MIFVIVLVVGFVGAFFLDVLGLGGLQINKMVNGEYVLIFFFIILIVKILIIVVCISFGFFGGVFGFVLFVGAALGGILVGLFVQIGLLIDYGSIITIVILVVVGSLVIGALIIVVLIVVEFTGLYEYGLMVLLFVTFCLMFIYWFFGFSFFDR